MTSSYFTGMKENGCRWLATSASLVMSYPMINIEQWRELGCWFELGGLVVGLDWGSCRKYCVEAGTRVSQTKRHGWVVMGAEKHFDMLGVSISEALPHYAASLSDLPCQQCDAEKSQLDCCDAVNAGSKRLKTDY